MSSRQPTFLININLSIIISNIYQHKQKLEFALFFNRVLFALLIKITINSEQQVSMKQPNLPALHLFNRSPSQSKKTSKYQLTRDPSIYQVLRESHKIQNHAYIPTVVPAPTLFDIHYRQIHDQMEQDYRNSHYHTFYHERPLTSYPVSNRTQGFQSFRKPEIPPYENYGTLHQNQPCCKQPIVKIAYLSNQKQQSPVTTKNKNFQPPQPQPQTQQIANNQQNYVIDHNPYLQKNRDKKEQINPQLNTMYGDKSIIDQINNPSEIKQKLQVITKFVNQSKTINNNVSIMVDQHQKKDLVIAQVQTDDPNINRSSFLINKSQKSPQIMNKQNFQKTMIDINKRISNLLKLQLDSEDIIIDLSDLIHTKEQYVDESVNILSQLTILSQGKIIRQTKTKKNGTLTWPQGV